MTPVVIREAEADGVSLALSPAGTIKATGDREAVDRWLPVLRAHKPDILAALAKPDALWWRVAITKPGARNVEIDTPSGYTLADWQAYADRYHGPGCAVTAIAGLPKPRAPVNLDEALRAYCVGVVGITPAQFRALMSPENIDHIAAGAIHHSKTLKAYALSFAEGIRSGRLVPAVAP